MLPKKSKDEPSEKKSSLKSSLRLSGKHSPMNDHGNSVKINEEKKRVEVLAPSEYGYVSEEILVMDSFNNIVGHDVVISPTKINKNPIYICPDQIPGTNYAESLVMNCARISEGGPLLKTKLLQRAYTPDQEHSPARAFAGRKKQLEIAIQSPDQDKIIMECGDKVINPSDIESWYSPRKVMQRNLVPVHIEGTNYVPTSGSYGKEQVIMNNQMVYNQYDQARDHGSFSRHHNGDYENVYNKFMGVDHQRAQCNILLVIKKFRCEFE